jgi:hypothetical protein
VGDFVIRCKERFIATAAPCVGATSTDDMELAFGFASEDEAAVRLAGASEYWQKNAAIEPRELPNAAP